MRKILIAFLTGIILSTTACTTPSKDSENVVEKPGIITAAAIEVQATVEAIDYVSRTVTIRGPEGRVIDLHADERVRNFNQIEVGDTVIVDVLESIALYVQKHDGASPSVSESAAVSLAPLGDKPGIVAADTIVVTADVEDINYQTRFVTLKGPDGISRSLKVENEQTDLEKVQVGDQVVVRFTIAVAINVQKLESN